MRLSIPRDLVEAIALVAMPQYVDGRADGRTGRASTILPVFLKASSRNCLAPDMLNLWTTVGHWILQSCYTLVLAAAFDSKFRRGSCDGPKELAWFSRVRLDFLSHRENGVSRKCSARLASHSSLATKPPVATGMKRYISDRSSAPRGCVITGRKECGDGVGTLIGEIIGSYPTLQLLSSSRRLHFELWKVQLSVGHWHRKMRTLRTGCSAYWKSQLECNCSPLVPGSHCAFIAFSRNALTIRTSNIWSSSYQ